MALNIDLYPLELSGAAKVFINNSQGRQKTICCDIHVSLQSTSRAPICQSLEALANFTAFSCFYNFSLVQFASHCFVAVCVKFSQSLENEYQKPVILVAWKRKIHETILAQVISVSFECLSLPSFYAPANPFYLFVVNFCDSIVCKLGN